MTKKKALSPDIQYDVNGKGILIFDDLFDAEFEQQMSMQLWTYDYQLRQSFDNEFSFPLENEDYKKMGPLPETVETIVTQFADVLSPKPAKQHLSHLYAAAIKFGDSTQMHQDINCEDCVTFLYYANPTWRGNWAGETIFFNDDHDAICAVTPRPGRLVAFNAAIYHRAGVPNRNCPSFRYALSVFYRCKKKLG